MKYWLNLAADGRVLSAAEYYEGAWAPDNATMVDALPDGDLYDYLYNDGFVLDPLPKIKTAVPPTLEERMAAVEAGLLEIALGGGLGG